MANKQLRRLLDLPGIQALENKLLMNTRAGAEDFGAFDRECQELSRDLFGIDRTDTLYFLPDDVNWDELSDSEREAFASASDAHEAQFVASAMDWDEDRVAHLEEFGWDLTDDRGHPLRVCKYFCRQVESVAKGIAGTAPNVDEVSAKSWGEQMALEARKFKTGKR